MILESVILESDAVPNEVGVRRAFVTEFPPLDHVNCATQSAGKEIFS